MAVPGPRAVTASGSPSVRSPGADAVTVLTLYLGLLVLLPSRLTIGALGGAGSPALLLGAGALAWWAYATVQRPEPSVTGHQPVRTALFLVWGAFAISFVVAMTRAIDGVESSTANLGLVAIISWGGPLLLANDGIPDLARLVTLLRRLVVVGGLIAVLGMIQFITGESWIERISIPGLSANQTFGGVNSRGSFNRPAGTALHAIEFGAILTMVLPVAINLALIDRRRSTLARWWPVAALSLAVIISISRSALICAAVALVVLAARWAPHVRRRVGVMIVLLAAFVFVTIPGMLGTLSGMFTGIANDGSALSRVDSYAVAGDYIGRSPIVGRGFSTFLPSYQILDNQYLGLLIEVGILGTVAVVTLLLCGMLCGLRACRNAPDPDTRQVAQALVAALASGGVGMAFYDGFGFPMASGLLFLVLGVAGAMNRLLPATAAPLNR